MCDSDKRRRNLGEWGGEESPLESLDGKVMRKAEKAAAAAAAAEPAEADSRRWRGDGQVLHSQER